MALVLSALSMAGMAFGSIFLLLCIGCGLLYISEWVEEHPRLAKKIIQSISLIVVIIHIALAIFEGLSLVRILVSLICHAVYNLNANTFPFTTLSSFAFIGSCVGIALSHFMWFFYFIDNHYHYQYAEVVSFMGICVWLVPFAYFVSISTTESWLPESDDGLGHQAKFKRRENLLQSIFRSVFGTNNTSSSEKDDLSQESTQQDNIHIVKRSLANTQKSSPWNRKLE